MRENVKLSGDAVTLKTMTVEDITSEYINGLNDPEVNKYLENVRLKKQTYDSVKEYAESNLHSRESILFKITVKENQEFIGTIHVSGISRVHYHCSIGICIFNKKYWKKGYAIQSLNLVKDYLFKTLGLHYIEAGAYAQNKESCKLFSRANFSERYRVSDKYRYSDGFAEVVFLGVTNPDFDRSLFNEANNLSAA